MARELRMALARNLLVPAVLALCSAGAHSVTWLHYKTQATGEWTGGNPIQGFTSYLGEVNVDTDNPSHYIGGAGLPVRVNIAIDDNLVDYPLGTNDVMYQKFSFTYNPNTGQGNEVDTSTRSYRCGRTTEFVFRTNGCLFYILDYYAQSGEVATAVLEKGIYLSGTFVPTQTVIDMRTTQSVPIGPGDYRVRTEVESGWFTTDQTFSNFDNNNFFVIFGNEATNAPPVAVDDFYGMNQLSTLTVNSPGIMVNDSDPDVGDVITASLVSGPSHATSFVWNADGSFTYTPAIDFYGTDTFTYKVNDGELDSEVRTVHITVRRPGSQGFITGGGRFFFDGRKCTFGFVAKVIGSGVQGNLEFQDHTAGLDIKSDSVDWIYAPNQVDGYFSGRCTVNQTSGNTYFVQIHDRGEPGRNDDITLWVYDPLGALIHTSNGVLNQGNIVIHGQ